MQNQKIIALGGTKGGIGKSTLSSILADAIANQEDEESKTVLIVNFDESQKTEEVNPQHTTMSVSQIYNYIFGEIDDNLSIEETNKLLVTGLLQAIENQLEFDYIIFDTPGELNSIFLSVLHKIDLFIVPFMAGERNLNSLEYFCKSLFALTQANTKVLFIYNQYRNKTKFPFEETILNIKEKIKGVNIVSEFHKFYFSEAIITMENERKGINLLYNNNKLAYRIIKKRTDQFLNNVLKILN